MRRLEPLNPRQRLAPRRDSLAWQPGDQIDVDVRKASLAKSANFSSHNFGSMLAAGAHQLPGDKRLHAETHAIDARTEPIGCSLVRDASRSNFNRRLPPRPSGNARQDTIEIVELQTAGCAAAEINGFGPPGPLLRFDLP